MSTKQAEKAEKGEKAKEKDEVPLEQVFRALEQRVEGLAGRVKDLVAENVRLKAAVAETAAERDRAKKELEELRNASAAHADAADRIGKLESEREEVRARIERLLISLAEAEAASAEG